MALRQIIGEFYHSDGSPWIDGTVSAKLVSPFSTETEIFPVEIHKVKTDTLGQVSFYVAVPDTGTAYYRFTTPDNKSYASYVEASEIPLNFVTIVSSVLYMGFKLDVYVSAGATLTLNNIEAESGYSVVVTWGDGNQNVYSGSGARSHTYTVSGHYVISIGKSDTLQYVIGLNIDDCRICVDVDASNLWPPNLESLIIRATNYYYMSRLDINAAPFPDSLTHLELRLLYNVIWDVTTSPLPPNLVYLELAISGHDGDCYFPVDDTTFPDTITTIKFGVVRGMSWTVTTDNLPPNLVSFWIDSPLAGTFSWTIGATNLFPSTLTELHMYLPSGADFSWNGNTYPLPSGLKYLEVYVNGGVTWTVDGASLPSGLEYIYLGGYAGIVWNANTTLIPTTVKSLTFRSFANLTYNVNNNPLPSGLEELSLVGPLANLTYNVNNNPLPSGLEYLMISSMASGITWNVNTEPLPSNLGYLYFYTSSGITWVLDGVTLPSTMYYFGLVSFTTGISGTLSMAALPSGLEFLVLNGVTSLNLNVDRDWPASLKVLSLFSMTGIVYDVNVYPLPVNLESLAFTSLPNVDYNVNLDPLPVNIVSVTFTFMPGVIYDITLDPLPYGMRTISFQDCDDISWSGATQPRFLYYPNLITVFLKNISAWGYMPILDIYGSINLYYQNSLTQAQVDEVLHYIATNEALYKYRTPSLNVSAPNAAPSAAGLADKAILVAAGWTVTTA